MTNDNDIVIIGNTPEAIYAASRAVKLNFRVALVQLPIESNLDRNERAFLRECSHLLTSSCQIKPENLAQWRREFFTNLQQENSPAILSALGVDVIKSKAEFSSEFKPSLRVEGRKLRSPVYLLAVGSSTSIPEIEDLETTGYLTIPQLWDHYSQRYLPDSLAIIGHNFLALELAQTLNNLGKNITLIIENKRFLAQEDTEIAFRLQAHLEAEGIKIFTNTSITQSKQIEDKKWLQVGNQALEIDEIIIVGNPTPNLYAINLPSIEVKFSNNGVKVNQKLQTTNPHLYSCGSVLGGYEIDSLGIYEASVALKNALFKPIFKVNYHAVPYVVFTKPNLARVGMTESQAKKRYGPDIKVIKKSFQSFNKISNSSNNFLKIIATKKDKILGAHLIGDNAGELIGSFALAIKHKIKLQHLNQLPWSWLDNPEQFTFNSWQSSSVNKLTYLNNWQKWFNLINR